MAREDGTATAPLIERLMARPYAFDFFAAVRRLECSHRRLPRIGHSQRPGEDPVRFGQEPSLAFAPSTVASCRFRGNGGVPELTVRFLGLLGPLVTGELGPRSTGSECMSRPQDPSRDSQA